MLIFSTFALNGWAQDEYIINESFSNITGINYNSTSYGDWTIFSCYYAYYSGTNSPALRLTLSSNKEYGYATSKIFNYAGDVVLSLTYAKVVEKNSAFTIIINNGGVFEDHTTQKSFPVNGTKNSYIPISLRIIGTTPNTSITFILQGNDPVGIDDVKVKKDGFTLVELISNDDFPTANNNKTIDVSTLRTLTGGIWNTLCLPFDLTMEDMKLALGEGRDIKMRTFSSYADKVMTFAEATAVSAGTPFLIKLNTTVVNPTFHAVTVKNTTAQTVTSNGVSFVGTYSPVPLNINGTNLFITKNNTLALPAEGMNIMNGLRAYIVVPEDFDSSGARLMMDDGETTAVSELVPSTEGAKPEATYDLKGQRVENGRRGLYVINGKLTLVK